MLLMTFATKSLLSVSAGVTRVAAKGVAFVPALVKAVVHRREILRLTELDERGLKDLGLVRGDVEGALATSWLSDPSTVLADRSRSRSGVAAARRDAGVRLAVLEAKAAQLPTAKPLPTERPLTNVARAPAKASVSKTPVSKTQVSVACSA